MSVDHETEKKNYLARLLRSLGVKRLPSIDDGAMGATVSKRSGGADLHAGKILLSSRLQSQRGPVTTATKSVFRDFAITVGFGGDQRLDRI